MSSATRAQMLDIETPVAVRMSWTELLFLHWALDPDLVRPLIPEGLELDTFDGRAWVALVPFTMTDCDFAGLGWAPGLTDFHECNVRTYVRVNGTPGVWFFSLDAQHLLPVLGGRWVWRLNYVYSGFDVSQRGTAHDYALRRRPGPWPKARTRVLWSTGEPLPTAQPGSLEHFLTERYWLFTKKRGRVFAGRIHHDPWPLTQATLVSLEDSLLDAAGFSGIAAGPPASVLATHRIDVIGEPLRLFDG